MGVEKLYRFRLAAATCAIATVLLAGCETTGILTMPAPNPATDCQVRWHSITADAGSLNLDASAQGQVVTIIGAANCPPELPITVPSVKVIRLRGAE